jgi:hypothetical protein
MAIDPVGQHIFVSGGSGSESIYVLDLNGNLVHTITGEPVAEGMAVDPAHHTLYAALGASGQISLIDTTTLTETARVSAGRDTQPTSPVVAGGKLWVMGNGSVSMNLDGTGVANAPFGGTLVDASRDGNLVALSDAGYSPASISVMEVATKTPQSVSRQWNPGGNASNGQDISFDASGANVLFASGAPYNLQQYNTLTLASSYLYPHSYDGTNSFLGYGSQAVASPGGAYVAFGSYDGASDVYLYREDSQTLLGAWNVGGGTGMLAFSPDGSKLYSIGGGAVYVLPNPAGPDTPMSLTSVPPNVTLDTNASFGFASSDNTVTFKCSLDGAMPASCTSPASYSSLAGGMHTFQVQEFEGGLLVGSTGKAWMIETLDTTLSGGPSSTTYATSASFSFSSHDDNATFECSFDGSDWSACTSPEAYTQLGVGSHTFKVRAVDGASVDATGGATQTWTIQPPDTMVLSGPSDPTYSVNATLNFWSHDGTATFQCSLDGADWTACTSPTAYTNLALGNHTFAVRALNDMGVPDPVGASKSWTIVQVSNLTTQITNGPSSTTRNTNASFSFTSNDPTATFVCSLDGSPLAPCASPAPYSGLAAGSHTFSVYAIEGSAGDATGASRTWSIDLTTRPVANLQAPSAVVTGSQVKLDASASHDAFDGTIVDYKWDLGSGSFTLDTGNTSTTSTTYATPGEQQVRVQVTNAVGKTAIATATIEVEQAPPPGIVGFSINNGDYATSSPSVQLDVIWPLFAQNVLISNDGGFGPTGNTQTLPVAATIAWTLATGGSERLPHIVYLRFPDSAYPTVTFTDDIILDTTTPSISTAARKASTSAGTFKVNLVATEKLSGISQAQFSTAKTGGKTGTVVFTKSSAPGILKLSKTVAVKMSSKPRWTRVRSAAGKWSTWHAIAG